MNKYEGKDFKNDSFVMDECFFVNCVLRECDLFYSGGDTDWLNLRMENCRWHFRGPALRTVQLLVQVGMLQGAQIPISSPASNSKAN